MLINYKIKFFILILLVFIHIIYTFAINPHGHFTIDEVIYHYMSREFAESGKLVIWNGYQEFKTNELALYNVGIFNDELVPQYPFFHSLITFPLYKTAGYNGLFILNSFAFIGVLLFIFLMSNKFFMERDISLNACLIFFLATYAWPYSQAAWPHMISILFIIGAAYFATASNYAINLNRASYFALAAGLLTGIGTGLRLDVIFIAPILFTFFLLSQPRRPKHIFYFCIGLVPGLLALTISNYLKFGVPSPFSYGRTGGATSGIDAYFPIAIIALIGTTGGYFFKRYATHIFKRPFWFFFAIFSLIGVSATVIPTVWFHISKLVIGTYEIVIDLRSGDIGISENGLRRTLSGAMIYYGNTLKKSFLQSCPYLPIVMLPLLKHKRQKFEANLFLLYGIPFVFIIIYSYFAWHGGLCFNMRYLLPALPFTSILTAYSWKCISRNLGRNWISISLFLGLSTFIFYFITFFARNSPIQDDEIYYLDFPLLLSFLIFVFLFYSINSREYLSKHLNGLVNALLVIALIWSGIVSFYYDFTHEFAVRNAYASVSRKTSNLISPNSIIFSDFPYPFFNLIEKEKVRIAIPAYDNYQSFRQLIDFHLDAGRPVYLSFNSNTFEEIQGNGLLESLNIVPLLEHQFGNLVQMHKKTDTFTTEKIEQQTPFLQTN